MESSVSNQVNFSEKEMMKYSRNIMLSDIGVEGQKLLKNSTVTIIGVGGLGCACSQYLVASGIGSLNLFDPDQVDLSNLQRQILFREEDLNAFKVDAAVTSLLRLNPDVNIKKFRQSFEKNGVPDEIKKSQIVIDCSDNFETRRYTNNYCYKNKIPLISGSCIQWKGQLMKFDFQNDSACYECLFEDTSSEDLSCTESAIFSPVVGIIGSMLASESIKTITKISKNCQIFQDYDFKDNLRREISFKKNNQCKICGNR